MRSYITITGTKNDVLGIPYCQDIVTGVAALALRAVALTRFLLARLIGPMMVGQVVVPVCVDRPDIAGADRVLKHRHLSTSWLRLRWRPVRPRSDASVSEF